MRNNVERKSISEREASKIASLRIEFLVEDLHLGSEMRAQSSTPHLHGGCEEAVRLREQLAAQRDPTHLQHVHITKINRSSSQSLGRGRTYFNEEENITQRIALEEKTKKVK